MNGDSSSEKPRKKNTNNEDKWHIYYPSKANVYGIVNINSQTETYIQNLEMLDTGSNNTDEVLIILRKILRN